MDALNVKTRFSQQNKNYLHNLYGHH